MIYNNTVFNNGIYNKTMEYIILLHHLNINWFPFDFFLSFSLCLPKFIFKFEIKDNVNFISYITYISNLHPWLFFVCFLFFSHSWFFILSSLFLFLFFSCIYCIILIFNWIFEIFLFLNLIRFCTKHLKC